MDTSIIQKQFQYMQSVPMHSLALQNHIYGCFILMEDLAQGTLTINTHLTHSITGPNYTFPINSDFALIGVRYGFMFDTTLQLDPCLPEYKAMWLTIFKEMGAERQIEKVDAIEDMVIAWIQREIAAEDSFFINALETGQLPQLWIGKALSCILCKDSLLSSAKTEKLIIKPKHFAQTRRHVTDPSTVSVPLNHKKYFATTRRSIVSNASS